jgi:hypothetical protein
MYTLAYKILSSTQVRIFHVYNASYMFRSSYCPRYYCPNINSEAPHYVIFSIVLVLYFCWVQIFLSKPCSSFNVRDEVSQQVKFILIFDFLLV